MLRPINTIISHIRGLCQVKMKIILVILCFLLLSGCNTIYDLTNFILPNDDEFTTIVLGLDTPQKISAYLTENFTYEMHLLYTPPPYQFWLNKKGDCNDFSTFAIFVANYHGIETYQIHIYYSNTSFSHFIAVFVEDRLSFLDNWIYNYGYDSFREIVDADMQYRPSDWVWSVYKVYDYNMGIIDRGKIGDD